MKLTNYHKTSLKPECVESVYKYFALGGRQTRLVHGLVYSKTSKTITTTNKKLPFLSSHLNTTVSWQLLVTLTYSELSQSDPNHIAEFTDYLNQQSVTYFYVRQYTKNNIPHYHLLLNKTLPYTWISDHWNRITGLTLAAGTNCKPIQSNQLNVINYILKEFDSYGSNLDLSQVHYQTQLQLEEDTISYSSNIIEQSALKDKDSSTYQLFNYFSQPRYTEKFKLLYKSNLQSNTELESPHKEYFIQIPDAHVFRTLTLYFLKYQHVEFRWIPFLNRVAFAVYKLNEKSELTTPAQFNSVFGRHGTYIGFLLISIFVRSLEGLVKQEYFPGTSLKGKDYITERFSISYELDHLVKALVSEGFIFGTLPMLCPPLNWTRAERDLRKNYTGGYLINKDNHLFPLTDTPDAKLFLAGKQNDLIDAINRLQHSKFKLDWIAYDQIREPYRASLLDILTDASNKLLEKYKFYFKKPQPPKSLEYYLRITNRYLTAECPEPPKRGQDPSPERRNWEWYNKYVHFNLLAEYDAYMSASSALLEFDRITKLIDIFRSYLLPGDHFYFPYKIDFRGRFYVDSDLSPVTNKFIRALLCSADPRPFDPDWFKFHITKSVNSNKLSFADRVSLFDSKKFQALIKDYKSLDFYKDNSKYEDILEFYISALEWFRYCDFIRLNPSSQYYSNFLISVDATSSGNQIISLLLNDMRFRAFLNLNFATATGTPYSFYLEIGKQFYNSLESTNEIHVLLSGLEEEVRFNFLKTIFKEYLMKGAYGLTPGMFTKSLYSIIPQKFRSHFPMEDLSYISKLSELLRNFVANQKIFILLDILKQYAELFARWEQKFTWTSPLGIRIELDYRIREISKEEVRIKIPVNPVPKSGRRYKFVTKSYNFSQLSDKLNWDKVILAVSPDFIHSFDASVIGLFAIAMKDNEFSFLTVHDALLTTTGDMGFMHRTLRQINYDLFSRPKLFQSFLDTLDDQLRIVAESERKVSPFNYPRYDGILQDIKKTRTKVDIMLNSIPDSDPSTENYFCILEAFNMYS